MYLHDWLPSFRWSTLADENCLVKYFVIFYFCPMKYLFDFKPVNRFFCTLVIRKQGSVCKLSATKMSLQTLLSSTPVSFASFLVIMDRCWHVTQSLKLKGQFCGVSAAYGQCRTFTLYCFGQFHWHWGSFKLMPLLSLSDEWFEDVDDSQGSLLSYWDFLMRLDLCRSEACIARAHKVVFNEMTAEGSLTFLKLLRVKMTVVKEHFEWKYSCHPASIIGLF